MLAKWDDFTKTVGSGLMVMVTVLATLVSAGFIAGFMVLPLVVIAELLPHQGEDMFGGAWLLPTWGCFALVIWLRLLGRYELVHNPH